MDEVGAALIAIVLVLCAVFLPTLFLNGLAGAFYHQFAVTISAATVISLLVSLTLSPALAALLLKPHRRGPARQCASIDLLRSAGARFNRGFDALQRRLCQPDRAGWSQAPKRMMAAYAVPDRRDRRAVLDRPRPASSPRRTRAIS